MIKKLLLLLFSCLSLSSCSIKSENKSKSFTNYYYELVRAGDLHGLPPTEKELLNANPGFTNYVNLFDLKGSFINFQCVGNDFDSFHCETTLCLKDKKGVTILGDSSVVFNTYIDKNEIKCEDTAVQEKIGKIYYYPAYWCRLQCEYDVNDDGNKVLITFEFWKKAFNEVPLWSF